MTSRILVIEDEIVTRHLLTTLLQTEGHVVAPAAGYQEAIAMVQRDTYDLILLDLMLPDGDGLTLCRKIRTKQRTPIIIITAKGESEDVVAGLEFGADDYVVKPFNVDVLAARVRSQLRRTESLRKSSVDDRVLVGEHLTIDPARRDAFVMDRAAGLTQKEFEFLLLLARRQGRAVSKEVILDELFDGEARSDKILAVYVRRLRQKIESDPEHPLYLHTVRGFGYRLAAGERA